MNYKVLLITIIALLFLELKSFAFQNEISQEDQNEYKYLYEQYGKFSNDTTKAKIFSTKYLNKARRDYDTLRMANGYYFNALVSEDKLAIKYYDSIIHLTSLKKNDYYPLFAYYMKATDLYDDGHFKKAFDNFLKAQKEAKEFKNQDLYYESKKMIGILKGRIGEHESALSELLKCFKYQSLRKKEKPFDYTTTILALSDAYRRNMKLDSASIINELGYRESKELQINLLDYFSFNEGIIQFYKGNFTRAIDSISKKLDILAEYDDKGNLAIAHFYLGKTYLAQNRKNQAILEFKQVDSIFQEVYKIMPETRESYEILINHYKNLGDKDNQLKYIERLITADSVLHTNYRYLIKNVVQNYDTPRLLLEKQEIIDNLEEKKRSSFTIIFSLITISIIFLILWILNLQKQKKYKRRFQDLLNEEKKRSYSDIDKREFKKEKATTNIPKEIITNVLNELKQFEENDLYLSSDLTITHLAKTLGTNSKYFSRIINIYKEKSFNNYINDLRVTFALHKLKTDKKFRNYTIRAIAREVGFNNPDSFSKAFYKKHGIQPSFFIKELEKID